MTTITPHSPPRSDGSGPVASRVARVAGTAAAAWSLLFAAIHPYWELGGGFLLPHGFRVPDHPAMLVIGAAAVPICALACVTSLRLAGRCRGPQWLSDRRACQIGALGAIICLAHSLPSVLLLIAYPLDHHVPGGEAGALDLFVYEPWFLIGGIALALASAAAVRQGRRGTRATRRDARRRARSAAPAPAPAARRG